MASALPQHTFLPEDAPAAETTGAPFSSAEPAPLSVSDTLSWILQALLSLAGVVLVSPAMAAIAMAIKLTSRGPALYSGQRVGRGGKIFTIFKFRTLQQGAEREIGARLFKPDEDRHAYGTGIGRLLKRSKLDELPQLFNVVRGDMRLVGPRPLRPVFLASFVRDIPNYARRFDVPPGLTGIAQLRGGYFTSPRNKLRYDLIYIRNRSLLLDLKLVLLTLLRLGDRWLRTGLWILFVLLFVSFIPPSVQSKLYVSIAGTKLPLVLAFILLLAARTFWHTLGPRVSFCRGPLNLGAALFVAAALLSALFAPEPYRALQGAGYYLVTGFVWSLAIVNGLSGAGLATVTLRMIALTSVAMAVLGLGDVVTLLGRESVAASGDTLPDPTVELSARATSMLGNPTVLAVFLVLGIPLLFAEVERARTQRQRDFWLVCTTLALLGVLLTQSRVGLAALLVAGTCFFLRRRSQAFAFATLCLASVILLGWFGAPRFSLQRVSREATAWIDAQGPTLGAVPVREWLLGGRPVTTTLMLPDQDGRDVRPMIRRPWSEIRNMHLTLAREQGIGGWLAMMWVIFSALAAMKHAYDRMTDERMRTTLWAIISCLVGFLVAMNGTNALHSIVLQMYFWSLLGIGFWIVANAERRSKLRLVWRFGDAGD